MQFKTFKQGLLGMTLLLQVIVSCRSDPEGVSMTHTNRLINATSPYLRQHAHNPVDWYPWGAEAFDRALAEDKPVFLSIGYSTCHWCHVMAHESFEDSAVAKLLNDHFICIKVDREERPDIDQLYMAAATTLIGRGGWPLTIIMGADKRPFFAGTYFPRESSQGRVGLLELLPGIQNAWLNQRTEISAAADQIVQALQDQTPELAGESLDKTILTRAATEFKSQYDAVDGGFGRAPKFPSPHNLVFMLRQGQVNDDGELTHMALQTLRAMRLGGLFDQIGFGFHRYSTDSQWHLPHFEKMLYDQATLMLAYTEAWQVSRDPLFKNTVAEIFAYLGSKLHSSSGAFYSAEDADSDGEEGKFYVWSYSELAEILSEATLTRLTPYFKLNPEGNFKDEAGGQSSGTNIFHLRDLDAYQATQGDSTWAQTREQLYAIREQRVKPGLDDKILCDWNGLVLTALSRAARVFDSAEYQETAQRLAAYLLSDMLDSEGQLIHVRTGSTETVPAFVDDYSFLIQGLRNLYEATFNTTYIEQALRLQGEQIRHFWDVESGAFFYAQAGEDALFLRQKEIYDGAIPSGNSIAVENLYYLGRISENREWEDLASQIGRVFASQVKQAPRAFGALLQGVQPIVYGSREVVIAGTEVQRESAMRLLSNRYDPFCLFLYNPSGEADHIWSIAPFLEHQKAVDKRLTVYICENYTCQIPIIGLDDLQSAFIETAEE